MRLLFTSLPAAPRAATPATSGQLAEHARPLTRRQALRELAQRAISGGRVAARAGGTSAGLGILGSLVLVAQLRHTVAQGLQGGRLGPGVETPLGIVALGWAIFLVLVGLRLWVGTGTRKPDQTFWQSARGVLGGPAIAGLLLVAVLWTAWRHEAGSGVAALLLLASLGRRLELTGDDLDAMDARTVERVLGLQARPMVGYLQRTHQQRAEARGWRPLPIWHLVTGTAAGTDPVGPAARAASRPTPSDRAEGGLDLDLLQIATAMGVRVVAHAGAAPALELRGDLGPPIGLACQDAAGQYRLLWVRPLALSRADRMRYVLGELTEREILDGPTPWTPPCDLSPTSAPRS